MATEEPEFLARWKWSIDQTNNTAILETLKNRRLSILSSKYGSRVTVGIHYTCSSDEKWALEEVSYIGDLSATTNYSIISLITMDEYDYKTQNENKAIYYQVDNSIDDDGSFGDDYFYGYKPVTFLPNVPATLIATPVKKDENQIQIILSSSQA